MNLKTFLQKKEKDGTNFFIIHEYTTTILVWTKCLGFEAYNAAETVIKMEKFQNPNAGSM